MKQSRSRLCKFGHRPLPWLYAGALAALTTGCADAYDPTLDDPTLDGDAPQLDTLSEPLWIATTTTPWPNGVVNTCFLGFSSAERATIRAVVENGWEKTGQISFFGWQTCPTLSSTTTNLLVVALDTGVSGAGQSTRCTNGTIGSCTGWEGQAPTGDYNRVRFPNGSPSSFVTLHEFGHALGFMHETDHPTLCTQRTSGGISLENEEDATQSVMAAFTSCNTATALSSWDVLGARKVYGTKAPGSISGINNLCANIPGASTTTGTNIVGWPCQGSPWNQQWRRDNNSLLLKAQTGATVRCLNVGGGVVGPNFTPLISWDCGESFANEQFHFTSVEWGAMGDRCVQAESSQQGAGIALERCTGGPLQKWDFFESDRRIRLNGTALCVNVPNGSTTSGTELILWPCSTGTPFPNEVFSFSNSRITFGGKAFNIFNGTTASGSPLILWDPAPSPPFFPNEQFTIRGAIKVLGQCLDTQTAAAPDGVQLGVRPCSGSATTQRWEYWW